MFAIDALRYSVAPRDDAADCRLHQLDARARCAASSPTMFPLRFQPLFQPRVWGGRTLETELGHHLPDEQPYGESWEICDRKDAQSIVADGRLKGKPLHQLWTEHRVEIFGAQHKDNPAARFPVLIKILDCRDKLSVQVHPPSHAAKKLNAEPKTEMWFVARADEGAKLYAGLRAGVTRFDFEQALMEGGVEDLLHAIPANEGEALLLPAGRVHALGSGLVIYEIQQNSDSTFRVYDWNRPGLDGKPRELHVAQSLECINFQDFEPNLQEPGRNGLLPGCPHFMVRRFTLKPGETSKSLARPDDFSVIGIVRGSAQLIEETLKPGDFRLLPSTLGDAALVAGGEGLEWLEITMP